VVIVVGEDAPPPGVECVFPHVSFPGDVFGGLDDLDVGVRLHHHHRGGRLQRRRHHLRKH
jgi:hypothetical protein